MKEIAIDNKLFELYISEDEIQERIRVLSLMINEHYDQAYSEPVHIIVMMNGAFLFAADLVRLLDFPLHMHFVKSSSYIGMESSGAVKFDMPEDLDITGKHVLVIEDIVDTGTTFESFLENIVQDKPKELKICSLLLKKKNPRIVERVDFAGFNIEDPFVIGYGMDYNGMARDFKDIYALKS